MMGQTRQDLTAHPRNRMTAQLPTLAVIVASTRPGRVGIKVGEWFQS